MARAKKKPSKKATKKKAARKPKGPRKKLPAEAPARSRQRSQRRRAATTPPPKMPKYKRRTVVVMAKTTTALQKAIHEAEIACVWQGVHVECVYKPTAKGKAPWFTLTYMERS
jgi:hypothetical protein